MVKIECQSLDDTLLLVDVQNVSLSVHLLFSISHNHCTVEEGFLVILMVQIFILHEVSQRSFCDDDHKVYRRKKAVNGYTNFLATLLTLFNPTF